MEMKTIFSGIKADNRDMEDTLVTNQEQFEKFVFAIAVNCVEYKSRGGGKGKPSVSYVSNTSDYFLNLKEKIDFSKFNVIVIVCAGIKEVKTENKVYQVYFDEQPTGDNKYSAIIVSKFDENQNEIKEMKLANDKPECWVDQRASNDN